MNIGNKLKNSRAKAGLTQETVAEKVGVSRQTISNWENNKSYPDIVSVISLSDLYSVSWIGNPLLDKFIPNIKPHATFLISLVNIFLYSTGVR